MCLESGDDRLGVADIVIRRREGGIDNRHLGGVNGKLAREALPARSLGFALEARIVFEIGEDPVYRLHARSHGSCQAQ